MLQKLLICRSWMPLQERRSKASMMASPLAARQQLRHQQWVPQLITATGSVRSRQVPQVPLHPGQSQSPYHGGLVPGQCREADGDGGHHSAGNWNNRPA